KIYIFPALNVGPNEVNDIINFRIQTRGRFGVTVAPAECVLSNVSEVFDRNDVVGFRTSTCQPFSHDVFAANVQYELGDLLSVKFNVEDQQNQKCLRTELMVSGVSIGSVLEVLFESDSQIEFERRMNLIFIFQDPMTILYEGPTFTMDYVDPTTIDSKNYRNNNKNLDEEYLNEYYSLTGCKKKNFEKKLNKMSLKKKEFYESVKLYQSILGSDNEILKGLKQELITRMSNTLTKISYSLEKNSSNLYSENEITNDLFVVQKSKKIKLFNSIRSIEKNKNNNNSLETNHKNEEISHIDKDNYDGSNYSSSTNNNSSEHGSNIESFIKINRTEIEKNKSSEDYLLFECDIPDKRSHHTNEENNMNLLYSNTYIKRKININKIVREILSIICIFGLTIENKEKASSENDKKKEKKKRNFYDELPWLSSLSELKHSVAYSLDMKCIELFFCKLVDIICSEFFVNSIFNFITNKYKAKNKCNYEDNNNGLDKNNINSIKGESKKKKKSIYPLRKSRSKNDIIDTENNLYNMSSSEKNENSVNASSPNNSGSMNNNGTQDENMKMDSIFIGETSSSESYRNNFENTESKEISDDTNDNDNNNKGDDELNYKKLNIFNDNKNNFFEYTICLIATKSVMCCCILLRTLLEMNSDGIYEPDKNVYGSFKKLLNFIKIFNFIDIGISDILIKHFAKNNSINIEKIFGKNKKDNFQNNFNNTVPSTSFVYNFFVNESNSKNSKHKINNSYNEDTPSHIYHSNNSNYFKLIKNDGINKFGDKKENINMIEILKHCGIPFEFLQHFNLFPPEIKNQQVITQNDTFDLWTYILNILVCFNSQNTYSLSFPHNNINLTSNSLKDTLFDFEYSNKYLSKKIASTSANFYAGYVLKKYLIDLCCVMTLLFPKLFMDELKTSLKNINYGKKVNEGINGI
ncbi:HECT-domain (ubiquitin-transferase), putative, partial [Plasmodium ovale curtisi]